MRAVASESSGYAGRPATPDNSAAFWQKAIQTVCFYSFNFPPEPLDREKCGLEVVDTPFGALHSCGRAEKVYPS